MPSLLGYGLKMTMGTLKLGKFFTMMGIKSTGPSILVQDVIKADLKQHNEFYMVKTGEKVEYVIINGHRIITHIFKNGHEIWNCYGLDEISKAAFKAILEAIG